MSIQSVARAVSILHEFATDTPLLSVTELSARLGLDRSTTQRLAASLVQGGLLDQDPTTSKYRLGLGLIELAGTMLQSHALPQVVLPYLRHVADLVGESTYLGVLDGSSVLEAVYVPTAQLIDFGGWTGRRMPLYCTASGKVLLAYMAPQRQQQVLAALDLHPFTPHTITDVTMLPGRTRRDPRLRLRHRLGRVPGRRPRRRCATLSLGRHRHGSHHGGRHQEPAHQSQRSWNAAKTRRAVGREVSGHSARASPPGPHVTWWTRGVRHCIPDGATPMVQLSLPVASGE